MKKNTVQAQKRLEKFYGDSAPSKTTICRWYAEFKRGRTATEDAERSGRPIEAVTPETIKKVDQIVFGNRKFKLREIADTLKIYKDHTAPNEEERSALSPRRCAVSQVARYHGEIE